MVNIPPIPPLLCSTPPPIDFGEDDEDVDVLPPSLEGMDDSFGDFLAEDDIKTNEAIPSPRPPSACDLPKISIYDGSMSPSEETNHIRLSPPPPKDDEDSKNTAKTKLIEAVNFNVRNTTNETKNFLQNGTKSLAMDSESEKVSEPIKPSSLEIIESKSTSSSEDVKYINHSTDLIKNVEDLKIVCSSSETKSNTNRTNVSSILNLVSIEDIEDDISDDELYSPKTPKNFVEADHLNDYFKIEEIKMLNGTEKDTKLDSKDAYTETIASLDNNESASLRSENYKEFTSFSSSSFMENKFDMPPPVSDVTISVDDNDDDGDDFGEFEDFKETVFVNNTVPVKDINIKTHNDLELNSLKKYNTTEESTKTNEIENEDNINETEYQDRLKNFDKLSKGTYDIIPSSSAVSDNSQESHESISKQNSLDLQTIPQEIFTDHPTTIDENTSENRVVLNKSMQSLEECHHEDNSFGDFYAAPEINDKDDFENFAEFSNSAADCKNTTQIEESIKDSNDLSYDGDDEFADFESHKDAAIADAKNALPEEYDDKENGNDDDDDDDDDFGDFNTAEPITATASCITPSQTSQNITTESQGVHSSNLNERISKILQLMFSSTINSQERSCDEPKPNKIQDIPFTSIDAAKALEYQWLISDTRHSFIRSLGIDSKNILFGDNWNPSLPRFAANLSFNPLKPMKPVQSSSSIEDSVSTLEPVTINTSETNHSMETSGSTKKETLDLDWKSPKSTELTNGAYVSNKPLATERESLTIFESSLNEEEKFSKTPPISEMESVTTFSSPIPASSMDMEIPITQIELEENLKNALNINEVVATSTFTGSFKETHIYTPPQTNDFENKHAIPQLSTSSSSPTKASPIDFDYEKAAMGVIIDETVVKKEYRDVEYKPPFTMESLSKSAPCKIDVFETSSYVNTNANILNSSDIKVVAEDEGETSDDFSEFQSVSSDVVIPEATAIPKNTEMVKTTTVSHGGMILSPAILIPQAISMENQKPKIEWGDSTATINPEELARIEELFPEPRSLKSSNSSNASHKSTPTHQMVSTPSISATVANKELESNVNSIADDDDDWSDFVSVTVTNNIGAHKTGGNNNSLGKSPGGSPFQQRSSVIPKMPPTTHTNSNNDDEWSEYVSSAPPLQQPTAYRVPQFNSGAWQNANFYNNPLSMYHKGPLNIPSSAAPTHSAQKYLYNNNNNYNISQQPYQITNNMSPTVMVNNHQNPNNAYQQQVHVMQNFSTAPVPTPERLSAAASAAKNSQFQSIGSAKIAPSIALIPDLGFVAPAIPTHTSFINSLPKPSINMKK